MSSMGPDSTGPDSMGAISTGADGSPPAVPPTLQILEPEVRKHHRRKRKLLEFTHSSTKATMIMLAAAVAAIVIENTPALPYFADFWHSFELGFSIGDFSPHMSIGHFINDFLMALFFLLVGLEIKFEMTAGELTNPRQAMLPIVAAFGGAVVPAFVYIAVNMGGGFERGWGVPMANDIAFCLGILALLGERVPLGLRAFLSTATIADDMILYCRLGHTLARGRFGSVRRAACAEQVAHLRHYLVFTYRPVHVGVFSHVGRACHVGGCASGAGDSRAITGEVGACPAVVRGARSICARTL